MSSKAGSEFQNLLRIAVVDLEHRRASLRLHAHALEAEVSLLAGVVYRLGIVIQYQQRIRARVHHLHHQLEPFGFEIVPFVDQHRLVLPGRDELLVHAADNLVHHVVNDASSQIWL